MGKRNRSEESFQQIERDNLANKVDVEEAGKPVLQILNAKKSPANRLKVAAIEGSIIGSQEVYDPKEGVALYKNATIDPDKNKDKFFIKLQDPALSGQKQIYVNLSTQNPNPEYNDEAKIILKEKELGVFESESLLLTSDIGDDQAQVSNIKDNECDEKAMKCDRTFKTMLGGEVRVDYSEKNLSTTAKVPVLKELDITINILKKEGQEAASREEIERQVKEANEAFAAVGIKINAKIVSHDTPKGVDLSDGFSIKDEKPLFDKLGTSSKKDVQVFYVGSFDKPPEGRAAQAYAHPEKWFSGNEMNTVIMSSTKSSYVLAHEIGHILTNDGHYPRDLNDKEVKECPLTEIEKRNIMAGCGTLVTSDKVLENKRWNDEQIEKMQQSPLLKEVQSEKQSQEEEEEEKEKRPRLVMR